VENAQLFSKPDPTTEVEKERLQQVVDTIVDLVPCTACRPRFYAMISRRRYV
jgi:hypothetical protein